MRDEDFAVFAGGELASGDPRAGVGDRREGFVEDRKQGACGRSADRREEASAADHGAAAHARVADELHYEAAAPLYVGDFDLLLVAAHRWKVEGHGSLGGRRKAVEVNRGIDSRVVAEIVEGVDLEDLEG